MVVVNELVYVHEIVSAKLTEIMTTIVKVRFIAVENQTKTLRVLLSNVVNSATV